MEHMQREGSMCCRNVKLDREAEGGKGEIEQGFKKAFEFYSKYFGGHWMSSCRGIF